MSDEKPGIVGRLGRVIYWFGCVAAVLCGFLILIVVPFVEPGDRTPFAVRLVAVCFGLWLAGWAARYLLKGD